MLLLLLLSRRLCGPEITIFVSQCHQSCNKKSWCIHSLPRPQCVPFSALLCDSAVSVYERNKETFRDKIWSQFFFPFPLFFFWRLWQTLFCVVMWFFVSTEFVFFVWGRTGGGNGKFRNCSVVLAEEFVFLAFDLKLLTDSPLSFFQFFAVSCAVPHAFFFFPHTECSRPVHGPGL